MASITYHLEVKLLVKKMLLENIVPKEIALLIKVRYETILRWDNMSVEELIRIRSGRLRIKDLDYNAEFVSHYTQFMEKAKNRMPVMHKW